MKQNTDYPSGCDADETDQLISQFMADIPSVQMPSDIAPRLRGRIRRSRIAVRLVSVGVITFITVGLAALSSIVPDAHTFSASSPNESVAQNDIDRGIERMELDSEVMLDTDYLTAASPVIEFGLLDEQHYAMLDYLEQSFEGDAP